GIIGIIRSFIYGANIGRGMEGTIKYIESKMEKYKKSANSMCFPFTERVAKKRLKYMEIALKMIKEELGMEK
ncbi:MAG: hypothetical protein J7K72_03700, partial [Candidatus Aenigmarchaeota archaeon]|nr:hypothetical protein [Candidatus Aenigmarchaeota archaeon]